MMPEDNLRSSIIFGFDSAWTDQPKAPGAICAICAIGCDRDINRTFHPPRLASFAEAQAFVTSARRGHEIALVALDQPTVVPNATGMPPVDRLAASVVSHVSGSVQSANRGKTGMFCDLAPVWGFLAKLDAVEDPLRARRTAEGLLLIKVFRCSPCLRWTSVSQAGSPRRNTTRHVQASSGWNTGRPSPGA